MFYISCDEIGDGGAYADTYEGAMEIAKEYLTETSGVWDDKPIHVDIYKQCERLSAEIIINIIKEEIKDV